MCGICGYLSESVIDKQLLTDMNDTMNHRGPDDSGIWQKKMGNIEVGFAHKRLSILDLSELGHQPMLSKDGRYVITYNGEVYNYTEIREHLIEKGFRFSSNCDTEVILSAFQCWGVECFSKFNGMFAIAIMDLEEKYLVLARDRLGKKPLYYYRGEKSFVFASELKAIMKFPYFQKKINVEIIGNYLANKYIEAPHSIFENTYKMVPGTYVIYKDNKIETHEYWSILDVYRSAVVEERISFNEYKRLLDDKLNESVKARMIADVPLGTFLSGGIDSALITAIAQKNSDVPINTYTIGFHDEERNEAPYAKEIADYLGTKHHEHYVSENDIFHLIEDITRWYDEPFSDSSQLPSMLVSKFAAHDITVALSGDGGDELFCGYKMYDLVWIAEHADVLGSIAYHLPGIRQLLSKIRPELKAFINNRDVNYKTQLFSDVMTDVVEKILGKTISQKKYPHEAIIVKNVPEADWQTRRMLLDIQTYLPDEILCKMDRAAMKYSLEVRCPLLDYRVVEDAFKIPHKYKYKGFSKKHILKELAYDYIPKTLLDRPKKGFGVPLRKWLRTTLHEEVLRYAEPKILERQGIFVSDAIQELIQIQQKSDVIIYSSVLWSFYIFQKWYQMYIEDLWN